MNKNKKKNNKKQEEEEEEEERRRRRRRNKEEQGRRRRRRRRRRRTGESPVSSVSSASIAPAQAPPALACDHRRSLLPFSSMAAASEGAGTGPPNSASTLGLVPITRSFLAKFYDRYPYSPACSDIPSFVARLRDHWKHLEPHLSGLSLSLCGCSRSEDFCLKMLSFRLPLRSFHFFSDLPIARRGGCAVHRRPRILAAPQDRREFLEEQRADRRDAVPIGHRCMYE
jgi:hypothetical protein